MEYKEREYKLPKEQSYIEEIADAKGIEAKLMHFDEESSSCNHKAKLLTKKTGVPLVKDDCVKAVYLQHATQLVCIVKPDFGGHVHHKEILMQAFDSMTYRQAKKYTRTDRFPKECMEAGTCTPLPPDYMLDLYVSHFLVADCPWKKDADISVGGIGKLAHKTSLVLPYRAIGHILREKVPSKVIEYEVQKHILVA